MKYFLYLIHSSFFFTFLYNPFLPQQLKKIYTAHTEMKTPIDLTLGFWI